MALTKAQVREILSSAGVAADKMDAAVERIIDGHVTSINALREDVAKYKADSEQLEKVQKELNDLKKDSEGKDDFEAKYTQEHAAFEAYKQDIQKKEVLAQKKTLYKKALEAENIDKRRWESILKVTDLEALKIKDGEFTDVEAVKKAIKETWSDFVVKDSTKKSEDPENPPANDGGGNKPTSRAAQLQSQYNANLYGAQKETK